MSFDFGPTVNATLFRQHPMSHITYANPGLSFVCAGDLESGGRWGCGGRFTNMLELGEHFQSKMGQQCTKPPMAEDLRKQEKLHALGKPSLDTNNTEATTNDKSLRDDIVGSLPYVRNIAASDPANDGNGSAQTVAKTMNVEDRYVCFVVKISY